MAKGRRRRAAACALALALCLAACAPGAGKTADAAAEQARFDEFLNRQFVETMESDYTTAHVYLQDAAAFGVDAEAIPVDLGARPTQQAFDAARAETDATVEEFNTFDRALLTPQQQDDYDVFRFEADLAQAMNDSRFDYQACLFESMSGLHYQLPTLFSDWDVRSAQDAQDLATLLADVRGYVDAALAYTREQAQRGLLMIDFDSVLDYCAGICDAGMDSEVLASMCAAVDALGLAEDEAQACRQAICEAFETSFLPAYADIVDELERLRGEAQNNEMGLAMRANGRDYYELLMRMNTGSDMTVEQVRESMEQAYDECLRTMMALLASDPSLAQTMLEPLPGTGYTDYGSMLDDIQKKMAADFPAVGDLAYEIRDISPEIASSSGVAAYFNIPPLDGAAVRQLRVNPLGVDVGALSTYTTVAHEGFPGHMYQYAYLYENLDSAYRKAVVSMPAYTEGYAVYAEYEALRYLDGYDDGLLAVYRCNELATYYAIILADIGIHYDGWTQAQFADFMGEMGFVMDAEGVEGQYRQLQANPCTFEAYYVGYWQIAQYKDEAREAMGEAFSEQGFNEALLEAGAAPFSVVARHIRAYADGAQPAAAA